MLTPQSSQKKKDSTGNCSTKNVEKSKWALLAMRLSIRWTVALVTPPQNRGGVIFSLQFVCVCVWVKLITLAPTCWFKFASLPLNQVLYRLYRPLWCYLSVCSRWYSSGESDRNRSDIVCYLGILCKWVTAVLAWFSVFQVWYEVFIDG